MGHCVERDEDQGQQGFSIKTIMGRELSYTRRQRRKNMRSAERRGSRKEARGTKPKEESREVTLEDTVKHRRRLS